MKEFEAKVIGSAPIQPASNLGMWMTPSLSNRLNIATSSSSASNPLPPHIQFTMENHKDDGSVPFLDTFVSPEPKNTLRTSVYRKPTHTDQYLHWYGNHNLPAKYIIYSTSAHRAKVACTCQAGLKQEEDHIRQTLLGCKYHSLALNWLQTKINHKLVPAIATFQTADNKPATTMVKPKTITFF